MAGKTEEVSNSGRSMSVDISQKAPQGVGVTNVADSKPLISRIAQNKSIFNFYNRNHVVDWMIHVCVWNGKGRSMIKFQSLKVNCRTITSQ